MRALRQKASSERGASITFALLLFLVCAIISSIVIVAATAVGGRASKMAEMDQRYYAVNSAAELVRDVLRETTATVVTSNQIATKVYQNNTPASGETVTPLPVQVIVDENELDASDTSLVAAAALYIAQGATERRALTPITLTAPNPTGAAGASPLDVTIAPTLEGETLLLDFSNTNYTDGGTYTLRLTFKANLSKSADAPVSYGTPVLQDGKYVRDKTTTQKTLTTVQWRLIDLEPVSSASPGGA